MRITDYTTGEVITIEVRQPYKYNADAASEEAGLACEEETRTKQSFKDDADINVIIERFGITGELPENINVPTEQEFEDTFDFQTNMNVLVKAREAFMELPAKQRERFNHDPHKFMEFVHDKENLDEARKLGIAMPAAEPPPPPQPMLVKVVPDSGEKPPVT